MRNCWRTQHWPFYVRLFGIWNKLERWKSSVSGCLMSWPQIKKIIVLKCCLLLFHTTMVNHFSNGLWHVMKSGFYTTTSNGQLSGWTEKHQSTSRSTLTPEKRSRSLFGGLLPVWSTTAFRIPAKLLHPYLREACSANRWDAPKTALPAAGIGQQREPIFSPWQCPTARGTTSASKVERVGLWSFATFTWPLANGLPLLQASWQLFAGKMLPQPAGGGKCFPRARQMPKHRFLC